MGVSKIRNSFCPADAEPLLQHIAASHNRGEMITEGRIRVWFQSVLECLQFVESHAVPGSRHGGLLQPDAIYVRGGHRVVLANYGVEPLLGSHASKRPVSDFEALGRLLFFLLTGDSRLVVEVEVDPAELIDWRSFPADASSAALSLCRKLLLQPERQSFSQVMAHSWFQDHERSPGGRCGGVSGGDRREVGRCLPRAVVSRIVEVHFQRSCYANLLNALGVEASERFLAFSELLGRERKKLRAGNEGTKGLGGRGGRANGDDCSALSGEGGPQAAPRGDPAEVVSERAAHVGSPFLPSGCLPLAAIERVLRDELLVSDAVLQKLPVLAQMFAAPPQQPPATGTTDDADSTDAADHGFRGPVVGDEDEANTPSEDDSALRQLEKFLRGPDINMLVWVVRELGDLGWSVEPGEGWNHLSTSGEDDDARV